MCFLPESITKSMPDLTDRDEHTALCESLAFLPQVPQITPNNTNRQRGNTNQMESTFTATTVWGMDSNHYRHRWKKITNPKHFNHPDRIVQLFSCQVWPICNTIYHALLLILLPARPSSLLHLKPPLQQSSTFFCFSKCRERGSPNFHLGI